MARWRVAGLPLDRALILAAFACCVAFVGLGLLVSQRDGPGFELELARQIQDLTAPVDDLMRWANRLGGNWRLALISTTVAAGLLVRGHVPEAILLVTTIIPRGLQEVAKSIFDAPRPTPDQLTVTEAIGNAAYPSGHVVGTTVVFALVILFVPLISASRWFVWAVRGASGLMLLAVPAARIWSGAHWPSDVVGGWLFAAFWLALVLAVYRWYIASRSGRSQRRDTAGDF